MLLQGSRTHPLKVIVVLLKRHQRILARVAHARQVLQDRIIVHACISEKSARRIRPLSLLLGAVSARRRCSSSRRRSGSRSRSSSLTIVETRKDGVPVVRVGCYGLGTCRL